MGFREDAIAAYRNHQTAKMESLEAAARTTMGSVLSDGTKPLLDPKLLVVRTTPLPPDGTVVLGAPDDTEFLVQGSTVRLTSLESGRWKDGPVVTNIFEVGAVLDNR